jgi:predicted house-cleaning NTP pyrophosphatase (Maf/HAM1 superfamily)
MKKILMYWVLVVSLVFLLCEARSIIICGDSYFAMQNRIFGSPMSLERQTKNNNHVYGEMSCESLSGCTVLRSEDKGEFVLYIFMDKNSRRQRVIAA